MTITWTQQDVGASYEEGSPNYYADWMDGDASQDGLTIGLVGYTHKSLVLTNDGGTTWRDVAMPYDSVVGNDAPLWGCVANNGVAFVTTEQSHAYVYNWTSASLTEVFPCETHDDWRFEWSQCDQTGQYIAVATYGHYEGGGIYTNRGLFISRDYGSTWNIYLPDIRIQSVAMNPGGDTILIAKVGDDGTTTEIVKSIDYGVSWSSVLASSTAGDIWLTAVDSDGSHMAFIEWEQKTCWISADYGATWSEKTILVTGFGSYSGSMDMNGDGSCIIAAFWTNGCWISENSGDTWTEIFPDTTGIRTTGWLVSRFVADKNKIMYANSYGLSDSTDRLCISTDQGSTWEHNAPYAGFGITSNWRVACSSNREIILAGSSGDAQKASLCVDGSTWQTFLPISGSGVEYADYRGVGMSSDGSSMILLTRVTGMVFVSNDTGNIWSQASLPGVSPGGNGTGVKAYVSKDGSCMVVCRQFLEVAFPYPYYIYVSTDYGANWTKIAKEINIDDLAMSENGDAMFMSDNSVMWKSTDYGASWTDISAAVKTALGLTTLRIYYVACDISGNKVYLTDQRRYFIHSENGGTTWTKNTALLSDAIPSDSSLECSYSGSYIFQGTYGSDTVLVSGTSGSSFSAESSLALLIQWLSIDTNFDGSKIVAGQKGGYVYTGTVSLGGRIKKIAGILLADIKKVSGIAIENLKKIAGEEK